MSRSLLACRLTLSNFTDCFYIPNTTNMNRIFLLFIISAFIHGVINERVSVNDGGSVTLHTHTDLERVGMIVWRFNGERIARINRAENDTPVYESDERFTDRLKMNPQTGDLTITNITSELTGEYQLEINGDLIINFFCVEVRERFTDDGSSKGPSSGHIAGILLVLLVIAVVVVIFRHHKNLSQDSSIEMGTNKLLRNGDFQQWR